MNNGGNIPDEVRRFILTSIPSVPYLEALLLLRKNTEQAWDGKALAQRLYIGEPAADALLLALHDAGLLRREAGDQGGYRYAPGAEAIRQIIDQLADIYSRHLVETTNLIHSRTGKKAQQFADAFKLRKDT